MYTLFINHEWLIIVLVHCCLKNIDPIPAGVLENQDMLRGVNLNPPPIKFPVLCPNMTNITSLESSCALLIESAKKIANLLN